MNGCYTLIYQEYMLACTQYIYVLLGDVMLQKKFNPIQHFPNTILRILAPPPVVLVLAALSTIPCSNERERQSLKVKYHHQKVPKVDGDILVILVTLRHKKNFIKTRVWLKVQTFITMVTIINMFNWSSMTMKWIKFWCIHQPWSPANDDFDL